MLKYAQYAFLLDNEHYFGSSGKYAEIYTHITYTSLSRYKRADDSYFLVISFRTILIDNLW